MALNRISSHFFRVLAALVAVTGLLASEHHGTVKSGGLPVPGATVIATQGDQRHVTTTDENGNYAFADLKDGVWKIEVEMLGFARLSNEVGIAYDSPAPQWDLKFLPLADVLTPQTPKEAPAASAAPATTTADATKTPEKPAATTTPTTPAASTPAPATAANGGRGNNGGARGGRGNGNGNGNNGRPSLTQAMNNFQRADLNASGDPAAAGDAGGLGANEASDLSGSAGDAMMVNGSISRGLDGGAQGDWFGGPGGRPDGMGGPGGFGAGMNGGADGMGGFNAGGGDGGGRGGRGGPGGPGGGPGMGMGGPGGFGGRGGPGGFGGFGGGGRGGPGGGRGGRGGDQNGRGQRAGVASFGNARRDRRMQYNANMSFTLDNSAWDARSFSLNGTDTPKAAYAKARASAMVGGPLKIPHLLDGRKGTFTFNYQLGRTRNGTTGTQSFPTMLERSGDFSQSIGAQGPVTIYDPLNGSPFPGNVIPTNRISPIATGLLKYYPAIPSAITVSKYDYQAPIVTTQNSDNINSRLNQTINSKNRLSGGIGYMGSNGVTPNIFGFVDTGTARNINANISWGHNFSTRVINNLRYTFSRSRNLGTPYFETQGVNVAALLGINGTSQAPRNYGPPSLSFTNFGGLSDGNASLTRNQTSSAGDSLIWVKGVHNMTFGVDYRRQQFNRNADSNGRGGFTFTGLTTSNVVNGRAATGTGFDFADFLLGLPDTSSLRYGNGDLYFRSSYVDAYVNDDWRLSTKVTLNGGFRWDYGTPVNELYNRMVNLGIAGYFGGISQVLPGQNGLPNTLIHPDRNNFSPRLGFAYRPGTKRNIVVRGGVGMYYNSAVYTTIANNMAQQPPLSNTLSIATSAAAPLTLANGFPTTNPISNTYAIDPNYRTGYATIWQLAVQSDLGRNLVGTITYNGTKGTRLDQLIAPNSVPAGATPSPFPAGYQYEMSNGSSIYHGLSFQLQRRFRNGVSANAIYTYSKSIDDVGNPGALGVPGQNFNDTSAERAVSATSRTHVLNFNWQYSTGVGRGGGTLVNGWKGALLKDWTFTNAISVGSGLPLTPTVGGAGAVSGGTGISGALRANATGLNANDAPAGEAFNYAAFTQPTAGQFGTAGRDTIIGPAQFSLNGSLGRVFRVGERHSIDLRFDATNALNHVTFTRFNTTIGSNQVGLYSNANAMRSMTATLRFRW
jgi:hypothetical protein